MKSGSVVRSLRTILVTSTKPFPDGSSVAADIALMVARNGQRVALIDADLRRPFLHHLFNLPNQSGLMDLLHEEQPLESLIHSVNSNHLFVLTAGLNNNGKSNPFDSPAMGKLFNQLLGKFDKVIIHGPPFTSPEIISLASKVDGLLFLIYPGAVKPDNSSRIMRPFQKIGARVIGVVMRDQPKYQFNQSAFLDKLLSYDRQARLAP